MSISKKNQILVDRVLDTIDWKLIFKFYKLVGRTVATEVKQIPGLKKLEKSIKLNKDHIKDEVNVIIEHLVNNDIPQFVYGPWNFTWINGEWEIPQEDDNGIESDEIFVPIVESTIEVAFAPMVVISKEVVIDPDEVDNTKPKESIGLQEKLDKAILDEDYELASKIRDLIEIYKKKK